MSKNGVFLGYMGGLPYGDAAGADFAANVSVLEEDEIVGHAGYVVGYYSGQAFGLDFGDVGVGEVLGVGHPVVEELGYDFFCFRMFKFEGGAGVEGVVQVLLFFAALGFGVGGEDGYAVVEGADVGQGFRAGSGYVGCGGVDKVFD